MIPTPPEKANRPALSRLLLLGLSVLLLLLAMWAGLIRMGWSLPPIRPALPLAHGPLMIAGFLGTLIGIERAVALNRRWTYLGPALTGLGGLALLLGPTSTFGPLLITAGSALFVLMLVVIVRAHRAPHSVTMLVGGLAWLGGNLLWLGGQLVSTVTFWWAGFLILTIVGERLELSRVRRLDALAYRLFGAAVGLYLLGLLLVPVAYVWGVRVAGLGMIAQAAWLLRYDIATRTVRQTGLTRYIAACLLSGYVWLAISGGLALAYAGARGGPLYDAMLHSLLLGYVFAMIFGHAPIIFPAVLGRPIRYAPRFYVPLVLLHGSLVLRILSDVAQWMPGRRWGGMLNVLVLLLFFAVMANSMRQGQPADS